MQSVTTKKPLGRPRLLNAEPHPIDLLVGKLLRARRIELGLSQSFVAEQAGVTFQQLQKYELGKNRISASRLNEVASILGVPVGYFFPHGAAISQPHSADVGRLARECASLHPQTVKHLLELVRSIGRHGAVV